MHVALEGNSIKTGPELELKRNLIFGVKGLINLKNFGDSLRSTGERNYCIDPNE